MQIQTLILRRTFPRPVTFADLRRARCEPKVIPPWQCQRGVGERSKRNRRPLTKSSWTLTQWWASAVREATGAMDEVVAVVDGREVRVALVKDREHVAFVRRIRQVWALLDKADRDGYWERPHEVRLDLREVA